MKSITIITFVLLMGISKVFVQETATIDVVVKVTNLKSDKGKVFIALYNSQNTFLKSECKSAIVTIENKISTYTFKNLPQGTYAISLFHDENENGKMDTNFLGIPKENYGASNNAKGFMGPPKWEDAKFDIKNDIIYQTIKI